MTYHEMLPDYPWQLPPDTDEGDESSLQAAFERANGGPVYIGIDLSTDYADRLALERVRALLADDVHNTHEVATHINLRQAAGETPSDFVRRIVSSYLTEAMS